MKIRFGMALDGQHSWQRGSCLGEKTVGPLGLLNILETHLGLTANRPTHAERVIAYRECLKQADNGKRFYSRSFAVDELGAARALLAWRDDLYLYGWAGSFSDRTLPRRLKDLAEVEAEATRLSLAPSIGERLAAVADALEALKVPVDFLQVIDNPASIPKRWRIVLDRLSAIYPPRLKAHDHPATCLEQLQAALATRSGSQIKWSEDGSVSIVCAETPLMAAHWLSGLLRTAEPNTLIVNGGNGELLDDVLASRNLPRQGIASVSPFRPALQVLPLAIRLLWEPADLHGMLAFLTLPIAPLRASARYRLATAVAECPGFGGPRWTQALEQIAKDSEDPHQTLADIRFWVQPGRYSQRDGIPVDVLVRRTQRVLQFFLARLGADDPLQRQASYGAYAQANAFLLALQDLEKQGEDRLRPTQVEQLLAQAADAGAANPLTCPEVGSVAVAGHSLAVCEPADTIIWWWAALPPEPKRMPWYPKEHKALLAAGINWPTNENLVAWQAESWLTPILAARKHLVLVLPAAAEERHPVWLTVEATVRRKNVNGKEISAIPILRAEDLLSEKNQAFRTRRIEYRPLPRPKRWWNLEGTSIRYDQYPLSYSAVSLLLNDPYQWVLRYIARIDQSSLLQISDGPLLFGSLAHRLVEKLVGDLNAEKVTMRGLDGWFEREFPVLVEQEGAVLLAAGRNAELLSVKRQLHRALSELAAILRKADIKTIESERKLEGEFKGGRLVGYADLVLHGAPGGAAIVDMKWGGLKRYRDALATGSHLQLVLYAEMLRQQTGSLPALAYYILRDARLLPAESGYFPGIDGIRKEEDENVTAMWQRFLTTLKWRGSQLGKGLVEVTSALAEATPDSLAPEKGLALQELNPDYNVYKNLIGWEE